MKNVITFVVGVVVGILVIHGYDRFVADYQQMTSDQTRASSTKKAQWNPASKEPLAIDYGKPLFITDQTGDEFQLILFGVLGQPIKYEWTSFSDLSKGSGELFEKHEVIAQTENRVEVRDAGSEMVITIQGIHLEWSPKSQTSGWLYYDPKALTIQTQRANKP